MSDCSHLLSYNYSYHTVGSVLNRQHSAEGCHLVIGHPTTLGMYTFHGNDPSKVSFWWKNLFPQEEVNNQGCEKFLIVFGGIAEPVCTH